MSADNRTLDPTEVRLSRPFFVLLTVVHARASIRHFRTENQDYEMARKTPSAKSARGKTARPIFDSIRKPNAPPGHPLSRSKPDEVARPAGRKAKHKRQPEISGDDDN